MRSVLAFDVNETLLDLRALDPLFQRTLGDAALRSQWFSSMLMLALTGSITGQYLNFTTAQEAALRMTATRAGHDVTDEQVEEILEGMRRLPPHPDVPDGLDMLKAAGWRLVALTNSVLATAEAQLTHARVRDRFEAVFSADEVHRLKPAPEPYRSTAERCGVPVQDLWLVAAHAWDVSGAMAAGCHAAFIARPGMLPSPVGQQPELVVPDLLALATHLPSPQ